MLYARFKIAIAGKIRKNIKRPVHNKKLALDIHMRALIRKMHAIIKLFILKNFRRFLFSRPVDKFLLGLLILSHKRKFINAISARFSE